MTKGFFGAYFGGYFGAFYGGSAVVPNSEFGTLAVVRGLSGTVTAKNTALSGTVTVRAALNGTLARKNP